MRRPSSKKPRQFKSARRQKVGRTSVLGAGERLDARLMLAANQPFSPVVPDPLGWSPTTNSWNGGTTSIDSAAVTVTLPTLTTGSTTTALSATQAWSMPNNETLVLYGPASGAPVFRLYDANGIEKNFVSAVQGSVKDVRQVTDGFLVWGTVDKDTYNWLGRGFDLTYGGGTTDGFVAKLRNDGSVEWGTLIGAAGNDAVESVTLVGGTDPALYIVGNTTSDQGFVFSNTGDQVLDGTTATPNGFVYVLSADGMSHLWSSYLSPQDPRLPQPSGFFTARNAEYVAEVTSLSTAAGGYHRLAILVPDTSGTVAPPGGTSGTSKQVVTLVGKAPVNGQRTYEFRSIAKTSLTDFPLTSIRFGTNSAFYMSDPLRAEIDATAYDPITQTPGVPGTTSIRNFGRIDFEVGSGGDAASALITPKWVDTIAPFSLTSFFPTSDRIYLTGTALSTAPLSFGTETYSRYHTYRATATSAPVPGNYGDAVLAEMDYDGTRVRAQYVGNFGLASAGLKEKGSAVAVQRDSGTVLVIGTRYAPPPSGTTGGQPGQPTSPNSAAIDGRLWFYDTDQKVATIQMAGLVSGSEVGIVDGAVLSSPANATGFGAAAVGSGAVERTYRIRNSGTKALSLIAPTLPSRFALKGGTTFPTIVPVNGFADFTLVMDTSSVGSFGGIVQIGNNDTATGRNPFDFRIDGVVTAPPPSTFSVAAAASSLTEGNSGTQQATFTVTLVPGTPAPTYPLQVAYATTGLTATAGSDFASSSGTLIFNSGETTKSVTVTINGDVTPEFDETFKLVLSNPTGGAVVSSTAGEATVSILTDDGQPQPLAISFSPATLRITEGASGTRNAVIPVTLNQAVSSAVTVSFATANGTAAAGIDYNATSGTLTIPAGQTQGTISVPVRGDTTAEDDESFTVRLTNASGGALINASTATVTIVNDDGLPPIPAVRVSSASVVEGNTGTPKLSFTITLASAYSRNLSLAVTTVDGTARAGRDYRAVSNTVTILAGRTTATVLVDVIPNRIVDGNRTLTLQVRNGTTLVASGVGTILDDDRAAAALAAPTVSQQSFVAAFASLGASGSAGRRISR